MKQPYHTMFDSHASAYDQWFDRHPVIFQNELTALRTVIPVRGIGLEIGVGTGRFAERLSIPIGAEPSRAMAELAIARGIIVVNAKAESLPFHNQSFDYAVMITADCFLDDMEAAFVEARRILKKQGFFIVAMIDKDSEAGKEYVATKAANPWFKSAHFHSVNDITTLMKQAGFTEFTWYQTLFNRQEEITEPLRGFGKGSFAVICSKNI